MGQPPRLGRLLSREVRVRTLGDIAGRESGALVVLLVAIGGLTLVSNDFLTGNNLANLARQVSIFGILAIGQLFVILTGGIDLSVGSILALSGAITAQLLVAGFPIPLAMLIGIAGGRRPGHHQWSAGDPVQTATLHRHVGNAGYRSRHGASDHRRQHDPRSA